MTLTTIFADASVDQRTARGGWGCWIKTAGHESVMAGGAFKGPVASSEVAEVMALANAIGVARSRGLLGDHVMLQSDCIAALASIRRRIGAEDSPADGGHPVGLRRKPMRAHLLHAMDAIAKALSGLQVTVRHVKGHRGGPGRQWVNRQCDKLARAGMEEGRQKVNAARGAKMVRQGSGTWATLEPVEGAKP